MEAGTRSSGAAWRSAWQVAGRHPTGRKGSTRHPPSAPSSPPSSAASLAASALARSTASCATKNAKKIRMGPGWASGTRQAWLQSKPAPRLRARQQPSRMLAPPPPPACNDRGWCVACLQLADHRRHLQVGASGLQEIADVGLAGGAGLDHLAHAQGAAGGRPRVDLIGNVPKLLLQARLAEVVACGEACAGPDRAPKRLGGRTTTPHQAIALGPQNCEAACQHRGI